MAKAQDAALEAAIRRCDPNRHILIAGPTASGKSAPIGPETTVLEAAESVGVDIDNSCRAGTCGSCKVRLLKGRASMDVEDALDDNDRRDGVILACQAKSEVDLEVEA